MCQWLLVTILMKVSDRTMKLRENKDMPNSPFSLHLFRAYISPGAERRHGDFVSVRETVGRSWQFSI